MKLKKRFLFLIVFTIAAVLFSALFMMNVGNKYSVLVPVQNFITKYEEYTYDEIEKCLADARVTFDDEKENIVRIDKISFDRSSKVVKFDISAFDKGESFVKISFKLNGEKIEYYQPLKVTYFNIIINKSLFDFSGSLAVEIVILLVLLLFTIITGYSFFEKMKLAEYSYDMILYGGVSLFCLHQFLYVMTTFFEYTHYKGMCYFGLFASNLNNSVKIFCLLSIPVMFIMSIFVSVSNVSLIIHEGFRTLNMLGIILGVVWASSTIFIYILSNIQFTGSYDEQKILTMIRTPLWSVILYMECMLFSTIVCASSAARYTPGYNKDYIIILGCAIRNDGSLTPLLRGRVDKAIQFEKIQYEKTGKHAKFVPSGGQGSDEIISESEAMKRYLLQQNIPEEQILKEDKSVNTFQNMQFSKKIISEDFKGGENPEIAFSTTNYHVFRSYMLANKNQMKAKGMGCKTKFYFFPNAFLREFIGLLVEEKIIHIIVFIILSVLYSFLGILEWL